MQRANRSLHGLIDLSITQLWGECSIHSSGDGSGPFWTEEVSSSLMSHGLAAVLYLAAWSEDQAAVQLLDLRIKARNICINNIHMCHQWVPSVIYMLSLNIYVHLESYPCLSWIVDSLYLNSAHEIHRFRLYSTRSIMLLLETVWI